MGAGGWAQHEAHTWASLGARFVSCSRSWSCGLLTCANLWHLGDLHIACRLLALSWTRLPTLTHAAPRYSIDVAAICPGARPHACQPTFEGLDTTVDITTLRLRVLPRAVDAFFCVTHNTLNVSLAPLATPGLVTAATLDSVLQPCGDHDRVPQQPQ
jgi:hypothetical protein